MHKIGTFFKDKLVLVFILATSLIFLGGIWFAYQMTKTTNPNNDTNVKADLLQVTPQDHVKGKAQASVSLVEYLDFECSACGAYYTLMQDLEEEFGDRVQFVYRHFPLSGHRNAMNAALAVEAAGKQGQWQAMYDLVFSKQSEWGGKANADRSLLEPYAQQLGLNMDQFRTDAVSKELRERVEQDMESGRQLGVNSTPSFFLGGERIPNPQTIAEFRTLIEAALLKAPLTDTAPGQAVHEHADFKVVLNGKAVDFTQSKYQSTHEKELHPYSHLHDGEGGVVHKHRTGITLGDFFTSIGIKLTSSCIQMDTKEEYCSNETNTLKFFVNGESKTALDSYEFNDLDRILISYGPVDQDMSAEQSSISEMACMYSEKCPEKGTPPTENCIGGLGSDCL